MRNQPQPLFQLLILSLLLSARIASDKAVGAVGANRFLREVQQVWLDIYPFADDKVLKTADHLGLPNTAQDLAELCDAKTFSRLTAALMRVKLAHEEQQVKEAVAA